MATNLFIIRPLTLIGPTDSNDTVSRKHVPPASKTNPTNSHKPPSPQVCLHCMPIYLVRNVSVATMLRLDNRGRPQSPCPLVHPLPSLVPKPTRNPATTYPREDKAGAPFWSRPAMGVGSVILGEGAGDVKGWCVCARAVSGVLSERFFERKIAGLVKIGDGMVCETGERAEGGQSC